MLLVEKNSFDCTSRLLLYLSAAYLLIMLLVDHSFKSRWNDVDNNACNALL